MKKTPLYLALICSLITILSSCKADKNCSNIYCATPQQPIIIELRDSQDRDLLNQATPGYLDTAKIKSLNDGKIKIIPAGTQSTTGNKDRNRLVWSTPGVETIKLYLADGVSDDLVAKFSKQSEGCCSYYQLSSFTYNGVAYPQAFPQYFIIKK